MRAAAFTILLLLLFCVPLFGQSDFLSSLENARRGDADAQNHVGSMYSVGTGVKPNQKKAGYWFRKAAEQGYSYGVCNLGLHYGRGWGVSKNRTLMMKWAFAGAALDGLVCHPGDFEEMFKPSECQMERGWELAVAWLREHPKFKNDFGERPWTESDGKFPVTVREHGSATRLPPIKSRKNCRRRH
jgi:TPR repeat protein